MKKAVNHSLPEEALKAVVANSSAEELAALRASAARNFLETGFPTQRHEDWKYTDLEPVARVSAAALENVSPIGEVDTALATDIISTVDANWLVIANGLVNESLSSALQTEHASVSPLSVADVAASKAASSALSHLNLALMHTGLAIQVNQDTEHLPLGLLFIDSAENNSVLTSHARVKLTIAANVRCDLVEYHLSTGSGSHYSNVVIDTELKPGATLNHVRMQRRSTAHLHTNETIVLMRENSALNSCGIDLGGKLTRNDLHVDIAAASASATFNGLYITESGQHVDNHSRVDHRVGPANSNQQYRGVLSGKSRAVWNGKAVVHRGADGTDATQANHNLLLTEQAEVNAKPELEIYADEVKCAHGTTVGQLDESALFYLRSRGLDEDTARKLLVSAFADDIVQAVPVETIREHLADVTTQKMQSLLEVQR